jgi:hypothetical protein
MVVKGLAGERREERKTGALVRALLLCCLAVLFFSACDYFLLAPAARTNWLDPKTSVGSFRAIRYGSGNIELGWDWSDPDRSEAGEQVVVDRVAVAHRQGGPPFSRWGAEEYALDSGAWRKSYTDLEFYTDHYFALYPHEKGGGWLAPLYTSEYTDSVGIEGPYNHSFLEVVEVDTGTETTTFHDNSAGFTARAGNGVWHVVKLEEMSRPRVFSILRFSGLSMTSVSGTDSEVLEIYPLRSRWAPADGIDTLFGSTYFIHTGKVEVPVNAAIPIEGPAVTGLLSRINFLRTGMIAVTASGGEIDINYDYSTLPASPEVEVEFYND